jgi:hypothetical protein
MAKTYEIRACAECREEIRVVGCGDESWDFCEGCQLIEGETIDLVVDQNGEGIESPEHWSTPNGCHEDCPACEKEMRKK